MCKTRFGSQGMILTVFFYWQNPNGTRDPPHPINGKSQWDSSKTLPKSQRTQGIYAFAKITAFKSFQNFGQNSVSESWPNFRFQILTKLLAQNVDQSLTTKSRPNFSFKISTELQLHNLDQTSVSEYIDSNVECIT